MAISKAKAKRIRAAFRSGEILALVGIKAGSEAYVAALNGTPDSLHRAVYIGTRLYHNKVARYYAARAN